jgi:hypothetical protein
MSDTDKYEPTQIDTLLHNTREHSSDGWRKLSKSLIELSDDDRLLIEYAPILRAEVKRLRGVIYDALYVLQTDGWNKNRADAINRLEKVLIKGWEGEEE